MNCEKNEAQGIRDRTNLLVMEVSRTASKSMKELWKAFLQVGEPEMVKAVEKALRFMTDHSDFTGAMKVLEGIYALEEIAPSEDFTVCQEYPALAQMFMESFFAASNDFFFDMGMNDVLKIVNRRR